MRPIREQVEADVAAESGRRLKLLCQHTERARRDLEEVEAEAGVAGSSWSDSRWGAGAIATEVRRYVRLGVFEARVPQWVGPLAAPALLAFPFEAGLAIDAGPGDRERAVALARSLMLRLLASVPPGSLHFVFIDPVALGQSAAEFLHLGDFDPLLVDTKPWTSQTEIERRLDELALHLETVISKYLRGQFESIDAYNVAAGEVAEPYRVVVVFDFPEQFSEKSVRQLLSIIENGPRCGVHTVLLHDPSRELPHGVDHERLLHCMQRLSWRGPRAHLRRPPPMGDVPFDLLPDAAPPISFDASGKATSICAGLMTAVGDRARTLKSGPVTYDRMLPVLNRLITSGRAMRVPDLVPGAPDIDVSDPSTWWTGTSISGVTAPIGRAGAHDVASLYFSSTEVAGGAIVVGLPRSGKTTALHAAVLSMCMLYGPDEVELYLVDAKHGVEFKVYEHLPHARMVSINSEREFAVAVLQSLDAEIARRGELMKASSAGRANLAEFRAATGTLLPRIVMIMDEFHEVFEEDDRLGESAFRAFSNIVRQGPFAGVHMVVSSQTLSSMPALDRGTLLLLPTRVAFICNESDADLVMGDSNKEVRYLGRQGVGVLNPARGNPSSNKRFQGVYASPDERQRILHSLREKAADDGWNRSPRVFDGDSLAQRPHPPIARSRTSTGRLVLALGEPFDLNPRVEVQLRRSRGSNLLLIGRTDDEDDLDAAVLGALHSCVMDARVVGDAEVAVVDLLGDDGGDARVSLAELCDRTSATYGRRRLLVSAIDRCFGVVGERLALEDYRSRPHLLVLYGIQRATELTEASDYAVYDEGDAGADPGRRLAEVIRNGPEVGVHCLAAVDILSNLERRFGRALLAEFELRVLGSSASDPDVQQLAAVHSSMEIRPHQLLLVDHAHGKRRLMRGFAPFGEQSPAVVLDERSAR